MEDLNYNFVKFEGGKGSQESVIMLQKPNSIGFSSKFYQDNIVNEFKYAVLYFDTEKKAIGIKLTNNEEEKNKYSIVHAKKGHGGSVIPKSFFKVNKIDTLKYSGRYHWTKPKIEGVGELFVIELKDNTADTQ